MNYVQLFKAPKQDSNP